MPLARLKPIYSDNAGGRYGLLIEPESVEALTEALDRMMSDRKLRTEFADHAREAVSELDVTVVGCRWLKLLASLVP
jgi:glycosyltransferase involved in cell wall biosynthesis